MLSTHRSFLQAKQEVYSCRTMYPISFTCILMLSEQRTQNTSVLASCSELQSQKGQRYKTFCEYKKSKYHMHQYAFKISLYSRAVQVSPHTLQQLNFLCIYSNVRFISTITALKNKKSTPNYFRLQVISAQPDMFAKKIYVGKVKEERSFSMQVKKFTNSIC